jgi:hypothetical protein
MRDLDRVRAWVTFDSERREGLTLAEVLAAPEALVPRDGGASVAARVALHVSVPRDAVVEMITGPDGSEADRSREVLTAAGPLTVPVLSGLGDPAASPTRGPAFLRAPDTTIFVPDGWSVSFTPQGYGILSRESPE